MGPGRGSLPRSRAAQEMAALVAAHPTLTYIARGTHVATWMEDSGPQVEERGTLEELVAYLRARFGER